MKQEADPVVLDDPVTFVRGVGEQRAKAFAKLGITTIRQLMNHLPRRYEDRRHFASVGQAQVGEMVTVRGRVLGVKLTRFRGGYRSMLEVVVQEGGELSAAGGQITGRWFNVPYFQQFFKAGDDVIFYGKLKLASKGRLSIDHPDFETIENDDAESVHMNRIVPVYPASEGISTRLIRSLVFRALKQYARLVEEIYPPEFVARTGLPPLGEALRQVHFPEEAGAAERGRDRLAFDELFLMQLAISLKRAKVVHEAGIPHCPTGELTRRFLEALPFTLTEAQRKVAAEIGRDLRSARPMNRLLQGDVGSGKTVVAAHAVLEVVEGGHQAAVMAPTEILAEQHCLNLRRWFEPLGLRVMLRTGSVKPSQEADLFLGAGLEGPPHVVVGTHALLEDSVKFKNLGLAVIDEQHKFGVMQRARLGRKGRGVDMLVMTATPIPRTLSLTIYGDLDVSVIDELPRGRGTIRTVARKEDKLPEIFAFIRKHVAAGRQAYIVYPLVEESDKLPLKSVLAEHERLKGVFAGLKVELLHGRLKPEEKEAVMKRFRAGESHILVATSVIEVGVDVPNANIMLVENAERFGLSQLHQLRGRIGRGEHSSFCILVGEAKSPESFRRLRIMEETLDGFRIAEEDLRIRGPGNIFGTEQSGLPPLLVADLLRDTKLLYLARQLASDIVQEDPSLKGPGMEKLRALLLASTYYRTSLFQVG